MRDTSLDAVLDQLVDTIIAGGPEDVKDLPPNIRSFWSFRDQLSAENGTHLGTEKTKLLARDTVYWLNVNTYIDRIVHTCNVCQEHQPSQTPEHVRQTGTRLMHGCP